MNRVLRLHRYALLGMLLGKNLIKDSYTSFFLNGSHEYTDRDSLVDAYFLKSIKRNIDNDELYKHIIESITDISAQFPLRLNIESTFNKNWVDRNDISYYDNSYFSLVTETFFFPKEQWGCVDETPVYFTEKIFKPIVMCHPFVLVSRPLSLPWLKKMGYKTFDPYINESYDSIENNRDRLVAIVDEVTRLCNQTTEQWLEWQTGVKEIVEHNKKIFLDTKKHEFSIVRP
jgi:hypothetical protein